MDSDGDAVVVVGRGLPNWLFNPAALEDIGDEATARQGETSQTGKNWLLVVKNWLLLVVTPSESFAVLDSRK